MSHGTTGLTFKQWQQQLDAIIDAKVGLDTTSLPHLDLDAAHAAGESPAEYFETTVKAELDDLGFNVSLLEGLEETAEEARELHRAMRAATSEAF